MPSRPSSRCARASSTTKPTRWARADNAAEVWKLVQDDKTCVYLAGMKKIADALDQAVEKAAGSAERWRSVKQRLVEERRWSELTYI